MANIDKLVQELSKKLKQKEEILLAKIEDPITKKIIKFSLKNNSTYYRARTLLTKEPETINWIRNFNKGSIFYDIGANVGVYSLFAAITSETKTFSFEPESNNFQILMENIVINNLNYLITPYPVGISDKIEMTKLNLSKFEIGASHHTVGNFALDHNTLERLDNKFSQGIFSTTLDSLWNKWALPKPEYIKIDVDGIEYKIVKESSKTLKSQELKSILIEINPKRSKDIEILKILKFYKFTFNEKQVNKTIRESGPHEGYAEYIFYKS